MSNHKLLELQLKKNGFQVDEMPRDLSAWRAFIDSINRSYINHDNDRYLLERSMNISSAEMREINKKLESAMKVAKMGYCYYSLETNQMRWSKEAYLMLGFKDTDDTKSLDSILKRMKETGAESFREMLARMVEDQKEMNIECQIQTNHEQKPWRWLHVMGAPVVDAELNKVTGVNFVLIDVDEKKQAEETLSKLNNSLIISARRAGMADVATSILHNIGNVLNSANISANLITESIEHQVFARILKIRDMLEANKNNLMPYLTSDEKGKLIPSYLVVLSSQVIQLHDAIKKEIALLSGKLQHIKEITNMQNEISGTSEIIQDVYVNDLIETAIAMCDPLIETKGINIERHYQDILFLRTDRSKLLQILVNLIINAKEALLAANHQTDKRLTITCELVGKDEIVFSVKDNGIGISEENLKHVFNFGFTTKKDGHGFGMHSSNLAAAQLKGKLTCQSAGINQGSEFTLRLPVQYSTEEAAK